MSSSNPYVLTLSCPDAKGIVYAVSGLLFEAGCNIIDSQQYGDVEAVDATGLFFMRVHIDAPAALADTAMLQHLLTPLRERYAMRTEVHSLTRRPKVLMLVSKHGHCLNDQLFRFRSGQLPADIAAVVSNHPDFRELSESHGVPFHHLSLPTGASAEDKRTQERQIEALVESLQIDLVVLARYMQILSPEFCAFLSGRAINIHHSFLPSFKGAKPYYQAHDRGVKLIGATAHYVTGDLDEGPIIEQDVARVDHSFTVEDLTSQGKDTESQVLARAVKWHSEHRVLLNGHKTVIFR